MCKNSFLLYNKVDENYVSCCIPKEINYKYHDDTKSVQLKSTFKTQPTPRYEYSTKSCYEKPENPCFSGPVQEQYNEQANQQRSYITSKKEIKQPSPKQLTFKEHTSFDPSEVSPNEDKEWERKKIGRKSYLIRPENKLQLSLPKTPKKPCYLTPGKPCYRPPKPVPEETYEYIPHYYKQEKQQYSPDKTEESLDNLFIPMIVEKAEYQTNLDEPKASSSYEPGCEDDSSKRKNITKVAAFYSKFTSRSQGTETGTYSESVSPEVRHDINGQSYKPYISLSLFFLKAQYVSNSVK